MDPLSNPKLNGSPKSCYAEYITNNTSANDGDARAENGYPGATNYGLDYVNSQVKLLEAKLNYEKLNFGKKFGDMQNHYRGRITELEGRLVASEARFLQVDTFEAEKAKLENDKIGLQNQIKNREYKLEQSEIKRRLDLQLKEEESKKRVTEVNQQLHAEKLARKKADENLAALKINMKGLKQLVESNKQNVDDQQSQVHDLSSKNKQLKKRLDEMEEQCKKNSESKKESEEKYQQMKAKIDRFVAEANEKHQKEIHKTKEEAREKYIREMARYKDEVLLAGEKHHREVVGLKEELRQLNEKFRNQLAHTQIYHNDLAKNKEELGRVNAIHQNQLAMAQMHHRESEKLQRDLSQTRKEMTEAEEKHGKELAAAREQSAVVNDQHVKELERTKKKADEAIQKHMLESLNARQEASEVREKLGVLNEKCKTAEGRVVELEQKLVESSMAFEKLKLCISETLARKKQMEDLLTEFKAKGSTAQKEHTVLKKKFQEMAEELERAYADKDKQKCELESRLDAAIEQSKKTTELNFTAVRENLHLRDVEAKKKSEVEELNKRLAAVTEQHKKDKADFDTRIKAALITPPYNKHQNQKSGLTNADTFITFTASGNPSSSSSTKKNSQNQTPEQLKVTNAVMAELLEKERLKNSTIRSDSKSKDAEIARLNNLLSQQKKPSPPVTPRTSPPSTPADIKPQTLAAKKPDAPVTLRPTATPTVSATPGFKNAHDSVNPTRSPPSGPTNTLKRMASTPSGGGGASKLPKIPRKNENQQPKDNTSRSGENVDPARRTPEADVDSDCKIVKVINKKKPLQATKIHAAVVDRKPTIEERNSQEKRWFGSLIHDDNTSTPNKS